MFNEKIPKTIENIKIAAMINSVNVIIVTARLFVIYMTPLLAGKTVNNISVTHIRRYYLCLVLVLLEQALLIILEMVRSKNDKRYDDATE